MPGVRMSGLILAVSLQAFMPYTIFYLDRSNFLVGMLADYMKV